MKAKQNIEPCLWFNGAGEEAAKFYTSVFPQGKMGAGLKYGEASAKASGNRVGDVMTREFDVAGLTMLALNGGPHFTIDPSISFFVGCDTEAEIDQLWKQLAKTVRMELSNYPWAKKYGWCEDRFGVNWQLILAPRRQKIAPALLFANEMFGKAANAIEFYQGVFPNSSVQTLARDEKTKAVTHASLTLNGQDFVIMEGPLDPKFRFSEAISFMVMCDTQDEIDRYWKKLSAHPKAEMCGWLKDQFGVSWQITHRHWIDWTSNGTPQQTERVMAAIMQMKKPDLAVLEKAYRG